MPAAIARRPLLLALAVFTVLAVFAYGKPVFDAGFYYDDWSYQAAFQEADSRWFGDLYAACKTVDPAGRPGGCLYHSAVYTVLGEHIKGYHLMSIVFLIASTLLLYLLLVRCRVPRLAALAACALYVVYPGSDATRLWPTAVGAQYILGAYIAGVLLAIEGIRRGGRRGLALHAGSVALFLLMLFTYEIVITLIALSGVFYALATSVRRALPRTAFDLLLAGGFAAYRLVATPPADGSGFVVDRDAAAYVDRVLSLIEGAWNSFRTLYFPTTLSAALAIAGLVLVVAVAVRRPDARRPMLGWAALGGGAVVFAVAAVLAYVTSNDLYVPQTGGTFNRLNLAAAMGYAVLFASLLALLWEALRRVATTALASHVVVAVGVLAAATQMGVSRDSQDAWEESWRAQGQALAGIRAAIGAAHVPVDASIITFGHPIWERGYVPVFSAQWDMRGAIDFTTPLEPPFALPFLPTVACGPKGVTESGALVVSYRSPSPLWFINTQLGQAGRVASQRRCEELAGAWGRPPFMGASVTDPGL